MDDFRDGTIFKIFNSVIDGTSTHVSPCPNREKSNWRKFWSNVGKKNEIKKELELIEEEHKIPEEIYKPPVKKEETDVVDDIEALCNRVYCNIKMQDPCEICCCIICRAEDSPCENVPRGQRKSICECHPEEKFQKEHECCDACEHHGLRRI